MIERFLSSFLLDWTAMCCLSNDIYDYHYVSQGKITVASIDDSEEMEFTDVSLKIFDHLKEFPCPSGPHISLTDWNYSELKMTQKETKCT